MSDLRHRNSLLGNPQFCKKNSKSAVVSNGVGKIPASESVYFLSHFQNLYCVFFQVCESRYN